MSDSPATPDKDVMRIMEMIQPAVPSIEKLSTTGRLKQASLQEPSPASTYGGSAAGSSTPATPQDVVLGIGHMTDKMRDAQLDTSPTFRNYLTVLSDEKFHEVGNALSSPSNSSRNDTGHRTSSNGSSPSNDRINTICNSPTWRGQPEGSFVRQSGSNAEDPFVANNSAAQMGSQDMGTATYHVREDRVGESPNASTAQAHFGPEACVFVANLLQTATDQQLEQAVTAKFSDYGTVYVKIRRDGRGMPFAFAQYERERQAQTAVTSGRNLMILGRPCRTEIAKAPRTLYLSRISGGHISQNEACEILAGYGAIEEVFHPTPTECSLYGLSEGIFARFHYWDDCRDAQLGFRTNDSYRLEQARVPEDMRSAHTSRSGTFRRQYHPPTNNAFSDSSPHRWSPRSHTGMDLITSCSIFVGNLPPTTTEQRVHDHLIPFGAIQNVTLCLKQSPSMNPLNDTAFCFVEFASRNAADYAIQHASRWFHGYQLRIEHKAWRRPHMSPGASPNGNQPLPAGAQDALMMLYQRGVQVGLSQAAQVQPMVPQAMPAPVYASYPPYYPMYDDATTVYGSPTTVPSGYGHGVQSYENTNVASNMGHPQHNQQAAPIPYVPYQQAQEHSQTPVRHSEPLYQWPLPTGEN